MENKSNFEEFDNSFDGLYDEIWTDRFNFYKKYGSPDTPGFKEALKERNGLISKLRINMNVYAFFFGFIYFFIKGMWKGGITILIGSVILGITSIFIPESIFRGVAIAFNALIGMSANYTYYRLKILGEDDFNIFKGMRWV